MTNYYELYHKYGLPLEEAYYLSEFNYYITKEPSVQGMVIALREEICNASMFPIEDDKANECRRFMREKGYYDAIVPFIFQSGCDVYRNYHRPDDQKIRNKIDYLEFFNKGLLSLRETYVLAKNKNFLLFDNSMLGQLFAIEDIIFEDMLREPEIRKLELEKEAIAEHLNQKPRKQINGFNKPIGWRMALYMGKEGYTYDTLAYNSFMPIIKDEDD